MRKIFSAALLMSLSLSQAAEAQQASAGPRLHIVYTNPSLDGMSKHRSFTPRAGETERARNEIRGNAVLRNALLKRNVQLRNVIAIETYPNGSSTVYLR